MGKTPIAIAAAAALLFALSCASAGRDGAIAGAVVERAAEDAAQTDDGVPRGDARLGETAARNGRAAEGALADEGDLPRGTRRLDITIPSDPDLADALYRRGLAHLDAGELELATDDFTDAIRLNPNHAGAHFGRGAAFYLKGERGPAIADFEAALRIAPEDPVARRWLENASRER